VCDIGEWSIESFAEHLAQGAIGIRLNLDGDPASCLGVVAELCEKNRLSYAAKAIEDQWLVGDVALCTLKSDRPGPDGVVAANECTGSSAGAGDVRVADRVHDNMPLMVQV